MITAEHAEKIPVRSAYSLGYTSGLIRCDGKSRRLEEHEAPQTLPNKFIDRRPYREVRDEAGSTNSWQAV
jgi:hypothetical protein